MINIHYKFGNIGTESKKMAKEDFCSNCKQSHDCKDVYRQVGNTTGPSVVVKVLVAFHLPIAVFIISLGISENILKRAIDSKNFRTTASFLLATGISFVCILSTRVINNHLSTRKDSCVFKGDRSSEPAVD